MPDQAWQSDFARDRLAQTTKKWLRAQPNQLSTLAELQALLDLFIDE